MRTFIVALIVLIAMAFAGWISFSNSGDRATITIDTKEIRQDTKQAADKAKEVIEEASQKGREIIRDAQPRDPQPDLLPPPQSSTP